MTCTKTTVPAGLREPVVARLGIYAGTPGTTIADAMTAVAAAAHLSSAFAGGAAEVVFDDPDAVRVVKAATVMCEPCAAAWMRWLDYTLPAAPIRLDGTGIRTARDIGEYQQRRYQDWRDTIRFEQDLIKAGCLRGNHVTSPAAGQEGNGEK